MLQRYQPRRACPEAAEGVAKKSAQSISAGKIVKDPKRSQEARHGVQVRPENNNVRSNEIETHTHMNPSDKVNILMVDDQPAKLLSYEVILSELGENLIKATSGREALEQLLKNDVAVVLMDVSMPEIDGFEMADMIRQHPRFQKTAIIFISAVHLTDLDRIKGYQRGAVDYISVPVVPELLRAKVSVFAELHRKTRQLERLNRELENRVAERTEELKERADLLDLASEAIMVHDSNGRLQFWNSGAETLYGWKREEVLGQNIHQLLRTQWPASVQEIESTLALDGRWEGNLVHQTKDGQKLTDIAHSSGTGGLGGLTPCTQAFKTVIHLGIGSA